MDGKTLAVAKATDIHRIVSSALYFLPMQARVPLKFGPEVLTGVTCARACVRVADARSGPRREDERWPAHGAERADGTVHAAREEVLGARDEVCLAAHRCGSGETVRRRGRVHHREPSRSQPAMSAAAYVMTKSAPARTIEVVVSRSVRRAASQPRSAAAMIDAYSPLT